MRILEKILGRGASGHADLPPRVPPSRVPLGVEVEDGGALWPSEPLRHLLVAGDSGSGSRASGLTSAAPTLHHLREMVERRLELLTVEGVPNLDALNEARAARGEEALRSVTVRPVGAAGVLGFPGERGDADDPLRRACLEDLERIARYGRSVGVYVNLVTRAERRSPDEAAGEEGGG